MYEHSDYWHGVEVRVVKTVRRHKPGDFMAGYRIARAFLSGWTYVRVTLLSGQFCPPGHNALPSEGISSLRP